MSSSCCSLLSIPFLQAAERAQATTSDQLLMNGMSVYHNGKRHDPTQAVLMSSPALQKAMQRLKDEEAAAKANF